MDVEIEVDDGTRDLSDEEIVRAIRLFLKHLNTSE